MTDTIIKTTLDRNHAESIGRVGILKEMQSRYPFANLETVAYSPDWSVDSPAWCYGPEVNIQIELTGSAGYIRKELNKGRAWTEITRMHHRRKHNHNRIPESI